MYLDLAYIEKQTPDDILNLITSDQTTTYDIDVIDQIIEEVENEIDGYILASDYNLSSVKANVPKLLRRIALKLFKYYAVSRKTIDGSILEPLGRDIADVRDQLNKIVSGDLLLEGQTKDNTKLNRSLQTYFDSDTSVFNTEDFKQGYYDEL